MLNQAGSSEPSDWLVDAEDPMLEEDDAAFSIPNARNVLTSDEIEALLRPQLPDSFGEPDAPQSVTPNPVPELNDPIDDTERAHAARLATRLSLALSKGAGFKAAISLADQSTRPASALLNQLQGRAEAVARLVRLGEGQGRSAGSDAEGLVGGRQRKCHVPTHRHVNLP